MSTDMRTEMHTTLVEIDALIASVRAQHEEDRQRFPEAHQGSVYTRRDINGRPLLADLVCARANLLAALANIETAR